MALRLILVGLVAGLGSTVPSWHEFEKMSHSAQNWVTAQVELWNEELKPGEEAQVFVIEPQSTDSTTEALALVEDSEPVRIDEPPVESQAADQLVEDRPSVEDLALFNAPTETLNLELPSEPVDMPTVNLIDEASNLLNDLALTFAPFAERNDEVAPIDVIEPLAETDTDTDTEIDAEAEIDLELVEIAPPAQADLEFESLVDAMVEDFGHEKELAFLDALNDVMTLENDLAVEELMATEAKNQALEVAFEGVVNEMVRNFSEEATQAEELEELAFLADLEDTIKLSDTFGQSTETGVALPENRFADAVRLTREAVVAWASVLHGPAVVTLAR